MTQPQPDVAKVRSCARCHRVFDPGEVMWACGGSLLCRDCLRKGPLPFADVELSQNPTQGAS